MRITIENITPVFHPFIDEIELGFDSDAFLIWLKEGYVFSTTSSDHRLFAYDDYQSEYQLEQAIDRCLSSELMQITVGAWQKQSQVSKENIVDLNPAGLFKSGIPNSITETFTFDDGGAKNAGYKVSAGDCVCRSFAIVTGKPYSEIAQIINELGNQERKSKKRSGKSSARSGVYKTTTRKLAEMLELKWVPTMSIGSGCQVHLKASELPSGKIVVSCSKHVTAMIDGVIHDTYDPSRNGTRCVYGYWTL
jgi:hypothetical protein